MACLQKTLLLIARRGMQKVQYFPVQQGNNDGSARDLNTDIQLMDYNRGIKK